MNSEYFLQRIGDLEPLVADMPTDLLRGDLIGIILDVLAYARRIVDIKDLNSTLLARSHIDVDTLRESETILAGLRLDGPFDFLPSRSLDPNSLLQEYRSFIDRFEIEGKTLDPRRLVSRSLNRLYVKQPALCLAGRP